MTGPYLLYLQPPHPTCLPRCLPPQGWEQRCHQHQGLAALLVPSVPALHQGHDHFCTLSHVPHGLSSQRASDQRSVVLVADFFLEVPPCWWTVGSHPLARSRSQDGIAANPGACGQFGLPLASLIARNMSGMFAVNLFAGSGALRPPLPPLLPRPREGPPDKGEGSVN